MSAEISPEVAGIDEARIARQAVSEEHRDVHIVHVAPYLAATREFARSLLQEAGHFDERTRQFTTGALLYGDFDRNRVGDIWICEGLRLTTPVHSYEERFDPGNLSADRRIRVESLQVTNKMGKGPYVDGWRGRSQQVGKQALTFWERPLSVFNKRTYDDHVLDLTPSDEATAKLKHTPFSIWDWPYQEQAPIEAELVRENLDTFVGLASKLSMPLAAVAIDPVILQHWQGQADLKGRR